MTMARWTQLKLLLWKNSLLKRRRYLQTAVEVLIPLTLFIILLWIRGRVERTEVPARK